MSESSAEPDANAGSAAEPSAPSGEPATAPAIDPSGRHVRIGWWGVFWFILLGVVLESMHGFKVGWYLDVSNETRRLMWTLAHTHGTLVAVLNIVFGLSAGRAVGWSTGPKMVASRCYLGALVLLPLGFFLGGINIHGGDPGLGILLVPPGALLLVVGVFLTAKAVPRT